MINEPTKVAAESVTQNENGRTESSRTHVYFLLFAALSSLTFWIPIKNLITFAFTHDYGSHILLVVPLSSLLVYFSRYKIFSDVQANPDPKRTITAGSGLFLLGLIFLLVSKYQPLSADKLSIQILSLVTLWISGFIVCYGTESFAKARFPLFFLLLLVPFPEFFIDGAIFALQVGSSDVAYGLLRILNVPVLKDGFILRLPIVNLEVAKECSGIRSSIALLVTMLVVAEFALRSPWRKMLLVLAIIPILVLKNGVRIVTIYLLAAYLDPAFLHGWLHTSGGIVFYLLGVIAMIPITALLRRSERSNVTMYPVKELAQVTSG